MKTKTWLLLLGLLLVLSAGLSIPMLMPGEAAAYAEIYSDGQLLHTVDLSVDRTITVSNGKGHNVVTVRDGKIGVTEANCPDHYCMDRGLCSSGAQIVCLPNRLVISFLGDVSVDSVVG